MVSRKRTYSSRDKKRGAYEQDPEQKRTKVQEDGELRWSGSPPLSRPQQSFSLLKKGLRKFSGPVSLPEEFTATEDSAQLSVFDKALGGKLKTVKRPQGNIYGSREEFEKTMSSQSLANKSKGRAMQCYPSPPIEEQKQQRRLASQVLPTVKHATTSSTAQPTESALQPSMEPKTSEKPALYKTPQEPYVPKLYGVDKTRAPRKDLTGNPLSRRSMEAQLWSTNQIESPFLRLPAEVRNQIYEVLGGNTIKIDYQTYQCSGEKVVPVFRYYCTVYNKLVDPFQDRHPRDVQISSNFTLLSSVCRQLYLESAPLAYRLNRIAFASQKVMVNFLLVEQRLSSQQRHAFTELCIFGAFPGGNMMAYLPNVEVILVRYAQPYHKPEGWFHVIRRNGVETYFQELPVSALSRRSRF